VASTLGTSMISQPAPRSQSRAREDSNGVSQMLKDMMHRDHSQRACGKLCLLSYPEFNRHSQHFFRVSCVPSVRFEAARIKTKTTHDVNKLSAARTDVQNILLPIEQFFDPLITLNRSSSRSIDVFQARLICTFVFKAVVFRVEGDDLLFARTRISPDQTATLADDGAKRLAISIELADLLNLP